MKLLVNFVLVLIAILVRDSTARPGPCRKRIIHNIDSPLSQLFHQPLHNFPIQAYLPFQGQIHEVPLEFTDSGIAYVMLSPQVLSHQPLMNAANVATNLENSYIVPVYPEPSYPIPRNPEKSYSLVADPEPDYLAPTNYAVTNSGLIYPQETNPGLIYPQETNPGLIYPQETNPGLIYSQETNPGQTYPVSENPELANPVQTNPGLSKPVQTNPGLPKPVQTNSELAIPVQTHPEQTNPVRKNLVPKQNYVPLQFSGVMGHVGNNNGQQRGIIVMTSKYPESGNTVSTTSNVGGVTGHVGNGNGPQQDIFVGVSTVQRGDLPLNFTTRRQETLSGKH